MLSSPLAHAFQQHVYIRAYEAANIAGPHRHIHGMATERCRVEVMSNPNPNPNPNLRESIYSTAEE